MKKQAKPSKPPRPASETSGARPRVFEAGLSETEFAARLRRSVGLTPAEYRAKLQNSVQTVENSGATEKELRTNWDNPHALGPLCAARYDVRLTQEQFEAKLREAGNELPNGLTTGDLWSFYVHNAPSRLDAARDEFAANADALRDIGKRLRCAAQDIRKALKRTAKSPLLSFEDSDVLRRAAAILNPTKSAREDLVAAGVPETSIGGFADSLCSLGRRARGAPPKTVEKRFREAWSRLGVCAIERLSVASEELFVIDH
jgi:hypothetical protein